jgi:hypothetical protein
MRWSLLICVPILVGACAKAPPATRGTSATAAGAKAAPPAQQQEELRAKKPRLGEASVYVDGKPIAVMRVPEMPLGLKAHDVTTNGLSTPRYFMGEYLKSLGVDLAKVKGFQAYGGSRVAVVDGDELRRIQNGLQLSYSRGDAGKPRLIWAVANLHANTTIDMVSAICVYVDKEPPVLKDHELYYPDGTKVEGVPYAPKEISKGTRVYVDGQLVATVKRKEIPSSITLGGDPEHPRYSLGGWLTNAGIQTKGAKTIDFISGDDLIEHMDAKEWEAKKSDLAFTLPRHNQGQVAVAAGSAKAAKVSAVQIFINKKAPERKVVPAEDIDDQISGDDDRGNAMGGSGGASDEEL